MRGLNSICRLVVGGFVLGGLLAAPTFAQTIVTAGDDAWRTGGDDGTGWSFGDPLSQFPLDPPPPIPADFFGPGSDPFEGTITLVGVPVCSEPAGALESTDTIVRRTTDSGDLDVGPQFVEIQVVALSLVSTGPITVTYNGGQDPELWDVEVRLSDTVPQPTGTMVITKTHEDGGLYESTFGIFPRFVFTRSSPPAVVQLDCGTNPGICQILEMGNPLGQPNSWVLIGGPGGIQRSDFEITEFGPGIGIDEDCDGYVPGVDPATIGESNFQGGLEAGGPFGRAGSAKCKPTVEAERSFAAQQGRGNHGPWISSNRDDYPAPAGDGIPDVCQSSCCDHATATCLGPMTEVACLALPAPAQPEWFKGKTCVDPDWPTLCWEHEGACCDHSTASCLGWMTESACMAMPPPIQPEFFKDKTCSDPDWPTLCWEHEGACCDHSTTSCLGWMTESECMAQPEPIQPEFFKDKTCSDPDWDTLCWEHEGACCDHSTATCLGWMTESACMAMPEPMQPEWFKDKTCSDPDWDTLCWEHEGACCDHTTATCLGWMTESACMSMPPPIQPEFFKGITCADPGFNCWEHEGACCDHATGNCLGWMTESACMSMPPPIKPEFFKDTTCAHPDWETLCAVQQDGIPAVSEWGLIVMTLLLLTAGTVVLGRRRPAAA